MEPIALEIHAKEEGTPTGPARRTLFDLTQEATLLMERIERAFEETGGEATDEVLALLDEDLQTQEELADKLRSYCWVMKEKEGQFKRLLSDATVYEDVANNLRKRAERAQKEHDAMFERVHNALTKLGVKEIEAEPFSLKVRGKGGSQPVILKESDANQLPERFQRREVKIKFIVGQLDEEDRSELQAWLDGHKDQLSIKDSIAPDKVGIAQALKDKDPEAREIAEFGELGTKLVIE